MTSPSREAFEKWAAQFWRDAHADLIAKGFSASLQWSMDNSVPFLMVTAPDGTGLPTRLNGEWRGWQAALSASRARTLTAEQFAFYEAARLAYEWAIESRHSMRGDELSMSASAAFRNMRTIERSVPRDRRDAG